jgi:hypothetical protein
VGDGLRSDPRSPPGGSGLPSIYEAVSIAIATTFWVGTVAAVLAAFCVLFLKEEPMRAPVVVEESVRASSSAAA